VSGEEHTDGGSFLNLFGRMLRKVFIELPLYLVLGFGCATKCHACPQLFGISFSKRHYVLAHFIVVDGSFFEHSC